MTALAGSHGAGFIVLAADDSILLTNAAGEGWLAELGIGDRLPVTVAAVVRQARAASGDGDRSGARARFRSASGKWLVVRASTLLGDGAAQTAVTIEPARADDLAELVAEVYELTEREQAIARLVSRGLATAAIAGRLYISPWTVQDHLKSIFEKVGVRTRGELVARLFLGAGPHPPGSWDGRELVAP